METHFRPELEAHLSGIKGIELINYIPELLESTEIVEDKLRERPDEVQVELIVGVSGAGKTTAAVQKALVYEQDPDLKADIQAETGNPNRDVICFHISLGSGLKEGKRRGAIVVPPGKNPLDLTEEQFETGIKIMKDGVEMLREIFTNDPDHSVVAAVDTVALTKRIDTGGGLYRQLASDENVHTTAIKPNPIIEKLAYTIRVYLAEHPDDPKLNEYVRQLGVDFGVDLTHAAMAIVQSSGNPFARINTLKDYYTQLFDKVAKAKMQHHFVYDDLSFEKFEADAHLRSAIYNEFYPVRLEELGVRHQRLTIVQNVPIPKSVSKVVHSHFNRLQSTKNFDLSITENPPSRREIREMLLTP